MVLSTAIGFERQLKAKAAGMRTHTLVGVGAALFTIVSKYGFSDVIAPAVQAHINLDPSRVAAQIVSGIGFIGARLVFVRRNKVRGLATAASVWLTAAVGTASGAGLVIPAVFVVFAHYVVPYTYPRIVQNTSLGNRTEHGLRVSYVDGTGALRAILQACTTQGFQIQGFSTDRDGGGTSGTMSRLMKGADAKSTAGDVGVELEIEGTGALNELVNRLSELANVTGVTVEDQAE